MCRIVRCGSPSYVYGNYIMKKLSQELVKILIKKKLKLSFAESCTGGLLSSVITSIAGSSKVFIIIANRVGLCDVKNSE